MNTAVDDKPHPFLNKVQPFGFQSTSSKGNDFAASMVKSPVDAQGFFATGTTSGMLLHTDGELNVNTIHAGMHCYVMQMKPFVDNWTWVKKFGAFRNQKTPTPTTCTSVRTLPVKEGDTDTKVMVLGYTEGDLVFSPGEGELEFSKEAQEKSSKNKVNGFAMLLSVPHSEEEKKKVDPGKIKVIGGRMFHEEMVTYPISATYVGNNDMVVVSMVSDHSGINLEAALKDATGQIGDFEPVFRYGQFYKVKVERLSYNPSTGHVKKLWSETYGTDDGLGAQVTSVIYDDLEGAVTVAGTTHGEGTVFGNKQEKGTESDLDGFFFTLNVNTGKVHRSIIKRIETAPGRDEFISGMCKKEKGDAIYIVGSTNAIIDDSFVPAYNMGMESRPFNAFIRKINLTNMSTIWTRQIGPVNIGSDVVKDNQDVIGMGCAVDDERSQVYVSGTVAAGASVVPGQYPTGGQDIFVAGFQSTFGKPLKTFHTQHLGSVMDEYVATDGGGLTTDQYGNAVLFGTTKGNFIKEKPPQLNQFQFPFADIFLMSFSAEDAEHVSTIETTTKDGIKTSANSYNETEGQKYSPLEITAIILFTISVTTAAFIIAFIYGKRRATSEIEYQTDKDIARYIEDFEGGNGDDDNYHGKNIAIGNENTTVGNSGTVPPNEVSLPGVIGEDIADISTGIDSNTAYNDLMASYQNIMSTDKKRSEDVIV